MHFSFATISYSYQILGIHFHIHFHIMLSLIDLRERKLTEHENKILIHLVNTPNLICSKILPEQKGPKS